MSRPTKVFRVVAEVTISMHTDVQANSEAEAEALAMERPLVRLCHQCSGGEPAWEWCTSGELDGEPILTDQTEEISE